MNQENNILDDFLRQQVEETEFSFKEDYWNKMSEKLDNEDKRKKGFWLWRGLSMLAILIVVGGGTYLYSKVFHKKSNESEVVKHELKAESISETKSAEPTLEQQEPNAVKNENLETTNSTSIENQNNTTQSSQTKNTTSNSSDISNTILPQKSATQTNSSNSNNETQISNNETKPQSNAASQGKLAQGKQSDEIVNKTIPQNKKTKISKKYQQPSSSDAKNKLITKTTNSQDEALIQNRNAKSDSRNENQIAKKSNNKNGLASSNNVAQTSTTEDETALNSNSNLPPNNPIMINGKAMKAIDSVTYFPNQHLDPSKTNPRYIASLSNYIPEHVDNIKVIDLAPVNMDETNSTTVIQPKKSKPNYDLKPFNYYFLAGLNANMGMKGTLDKQTALGFSPYVGVGLEKEISQKITLASHVGFTYFNALNSNKVVTNTVYSFGVDSSNFSVEHKKLMQMYLPLSMNYEILKRHYLMLSIGASYSFDVSSSVKENSNANSKSTFGYKTGFNVFDFFMQGGYQFQLSNKFSFMLWYQRGFMDMTKNSYFNNTNKDIQSRISIGLKYSFGRNGND